MHLSWCLLLPAGGPMFGSIALIIKQRCLLRKDTQRQRGQRQLLQQGIEDGSNDSDDSEEDNSNAFSDAADCKSPSTERSEKSFDEPVIIVSQEEAEINEKGFSEDKKTWKFIVLYLESLKYMLCFSEKIAVKYKRSES